MEEPQWTGLQRRAMKYINKTIDYQPVPGESIKGTFTGFDKDSVDKAIIQISNVADRTTLPLQTVVSYFEDFHDAR